MNIAVHRRAHGAQINFEDLTSYLTYGKISDEEDIGHVVVTYLTLFAEEVRRCNTNTGLFTT
jgi:hypothetical protein